MNTILEFKGEYLNGQRNRKGKEYKENGELIFEGEYLYNYRIRGKEYNNGKLEYEGEYLYGKKWNRKGFDENGVLIYELKNGNGKVREFYDGKLIFEGQYLKGKRNGEGKEFYENGKLRFEGEYLSGQKMEEQKIMIILIMKYYWKVNI